MQIEKVLPAAEMIITGVGTPHGRDLIIDQLKTLDLLPADEEEAGTVTERVILPGTIDQRGNAWRIATPRWRLLTHSQFIGLKDT